MRETVALVPQVFYDLIGRTVPGAAILLAGFFLFTNEVRTVAVVQFTLKDPRIPVSILLTVGLLASYLLGTLLGAICFAVIDIMSSDRPPSDAYRTRGLSDVEAIPPDGQKLDAARLSYMYDFIQLVDAPAGARLAKLRGETHMCQVLIVGSVMLAVAYATTNLPLLVTGRFWVVLGSLAAAAAASYLLWVHLAFRTRRLMVNCWALLREATTAAVEESARLTSASSRRPHQRI